MVQTFAAIIILIQLQSALSCRVGLTRGRHSPDVSLVLNIIQFQSINLYMQVGIYKYVYMCMYIYINNKIIHTQK